MFLIDMIDKSPAAGAPPGAELDALVRTAVKTIVAEAKPGIPYCQLQIAYILMDAGVVKGANLHDTLMLVRSALGILIKKHGWKTHKHWPIYARPEKQKTTVPLVLAYAVTPGVAQNSNTLTRVVQMLTGLEQAPNAIRRTISRMVSAGTYKRVGEGLYVNCQRGGSLV